MLRGTLSISNTAHGGANACLRVRTPRGKTSQRYLTTVPHLVSSDVDSFRANAFQPKLPHKVDLIDGQLRGTCRKWFLRDQHSAYRLDEAFWATHKDSIVPLEITRITEAGDASFEQIEAPLELLILSMQESEPGVNNQPSIYLAQHDLRDLPQQMRDDLPTPELVKYAGKGDLYNSSLWLGKSPTYTPLHRDPNPNILFQMAGKKVVRLFDAETGSAIFNHIQRQLGRDATAGRIRGEEMMGGKERSLLHDLVWNEASSSSATIIEHCQEAILEPGEALFIPQGLWHSVKGIGDGIVASANWWFR